MILRLPILLLALSTGAAVAQITVVSQTWVCERGVTVPVTRVSDPDGAVVVMTVEGSQITLHGEMGADSGRFSWPSGGSGYIWSEEAGQASVLWHDGMNGTELSVLAGCTPQE